MLGRGRMQEMRWLAGLIAALAVSTVIVTLVIQPWTGPEKRNAQLDEAVIEESSTIVDTSPPPIEAVEQRPVRQPGQGVAAARLVVPRLSIDARTVTLGLDSKGGMLAPTSPTDVAWYSFSSKPGAGGNIVMSGHVDFASYGPAVFWRLRELRPGDIIQILLMDQSVASYQVTTVSNYDARTAPVQEIVGRTPFEIITLITCDGVFDSASRQYDKRLVVRGIRV